MTTRASRAQKVIYSLSDLQIADSSDLILSNGVVGVLHQCLSATEEVKYPEVANLAQQVGDIRTVHNMKFPVFCFSRTVT